MRNLQFYLMVGVISLFIACGGGSNDIVIAPPTGLIASYSFDDGYGNLAFDGTNTKAHGIITAASRVEGKIGNGLLFGLDDSYVSVNDGLYFNDGLITIEAWIKPNAMEAGKVYRIIGDYNYSCFYFQIRDGRLEILYDGKSYHYGTASIPINVWTHVAVTSDGKDIITYINGIEDARTNITLPIQYILNIRIGAHRIYTGGSSLEDYIEEFPGIIDELRIWNVARSQSQISSNLEKQLLTPPILTIADPYLTASYNFNELSGITAFDTSGNNHDGIITAASRVEGKIGNALLFGLDDSYVTIKDGLYFNNGLISIEAWIKPNAMEAGKVYRIIGDYNYYCFYFQIRDGRLEILYDGKSYHYGTASIPINVWTHIAVTSDGKDIVTYINGIEDARTNITLPIQYILNIRIGAHWIYPEDYIEEFPGMIDELRIWNGVLTVNHLSY